MYKRQVTYPKNEHLREAAAAVALERLLVETDSPFLAPQPVSYTHLRAHETVLDLVCRLLLEKKTTTTLAQHAQSEYTAHSHSS